MSANRRSDAVALVRQAAEHLAVAGDELDKVASMLLAELATGLTDGTADRASIARMTEIASIWSIPADYDPDAEDE